jgi:hypothetical protein
MMTSLRTLAAFCATFVWVETCYADCSSLRALAQQHANDMARRNSLDHAGFLQHRGAAGVVAENVAMGCGTEACARDYRFAIALRGNGTTSQIPVGEARFRRTSTDSGLYNPIPCCGEPRH